MSHAADAQSPVACSIKVTQHTDGAVMLEGVVTAQMPVAGTYSMRVLQKGGGNESSIEQEGDFAAAPGKPGTLNQVAISGTDLSYEAELTVTWPGGSHTCTEASVIKL